MYLVLAVSEEAQAVAEQSPQMTLFHAHTLIMVVVQEAMLQLQQPMQTYQ
jgi:hypothetical protein